MMNEDFSDLNTKPQEDTELPIPNNAPLPTFQEKKSDPYVKDFVDSILRINAVKDYTKLPANISHQVKKTKF